MNEKKTFRNVYYVYITQRVSVHLKSISIKHFQKHKNHDDDIKYCPESKLKYAIGSIMVGMNQQEKFSMGSRINSKCSNNNHI